VALGFSGPGRWLAAGWVRARVRARGFGSLVSLGGVPGARCVVVFVGSALALRQVAR